MSFRNIDLIAYMAVWCGFVLLITRIGSARRRNR